MRRTTSVGPKSSFISGMSHLTIISSKNFANKEKKNISHMIGLHLMEADGDR